MYKVKKIGYITGEEIKIQKRRKRITRDSKIWKIWRTTITMATCIYCASMNGKILADDDPLVDVIPVHPNCKCIIERLLGILAGTVTNDEEDGVDVFFLNHGHLPTYYISSKEATMKGWDKLKGNLAEVLPGRVIGGDVFQNRKKKLPTKSGRIWYEADFDYTRGYRNSCRLLYSNDGLLFVTYDHYVSFYEVVVGD